MCSDPNKVQVDWTKISTQSVGNVQITNVTQTNLSNNQSNSLITSCNEGANLLIGHENFGYNGADKKNGNR